MQPETFMARPKTWLRIMSDTTAPSISTAPNFAYQTCVERIPPDEVAELDLSRWRVAGCGAERVRASTLEGFAEHFAPAGFRQESFAPCYGMAEVGLAISFSRRGIGAAVDYVDRDRCVDERFAAEVVVRDAHYMVPADVAERMLAAPGSSARGLLSVLVEWFFDGEVVRRLGPGAFRPQPKIESAFVRLTPHEPPACAAGKPHRRAVVQGGFAHRRKTLVNSLRQSGWERDDIEVALAAAGIDAGARAEAVEVAQFARLAEELPELGR